MRRVWLTIALLGAAVSAPASAQTVIFGIGGGLTGQANVTHVRVPIYADMRGAPGVKLGSYTVRVQWDPTVLGLWATEEGAFGTPLVFQDSAYAGVLRVGGISSAGLDGVFELVALQFDALRDTLSAVTLTVTEAVAAGTFANITGQVTVVNGTYCPAVGRWGDLDRDGVANSRDALAILSSIVGIALDSTFTIALGDVDGDAVVNSRDALITLSYAVGLAIPGQRVLVLAPGAACGPGGATGLALLPDTIDLVAGQLLRPLLTGTGSGGTAGTNATWTTGDPEIATVGFDGMVVGRSPGTTTVTAALGPGITASVPVVVRARRGVWHVDATRATLAAIQMGTAKYPFATPQYAFPVADDGDTVLVAPGTHDYLGSEICNGYWYGDTPPATGGGAGSPPPEQCALQGYLTKKLVLRGDTLADGTRPVLRGNDDAYYAASLDLTASLDVRDLEFRNFDFAVWVDGAAGFVRMQNVLVSSALNQYSGGAVASYYYNGGLDSVVIRDTEVLLDTAASNYAFDIEYAGVAVLERVTVRSRYGAYLYAVDSVAVLDSDILTRWEALYIDGDWDRGGSAVYLARSRTQSTSDWNTYAYNIRTMRSERNVYSIAASSYEALYLNGLDYPPRANSWFVSFGDSVVAPPGFGGSYVGGFDVYDLDSVLVDSLTMVVPDSGAIFSPGYLYGNRVRVDRSRFLNLGSGYPLYVGGKDVRVTNSYFQGCRTSCGGAYALQLEGYVDSLHRGEVSGNTFYRMVRPIYIQPNYDPYRVYVSGNVADSITGTAFQLYGDSIFVSDNVLTRVYSNGIFVAPGASDPAPYARLERNRVTQAPGAGGSAVQYSGAYGDMVGNRLTGSWALYLYNYYSTVMPFSMTGDTLVADSAVGGYGLYLTGPWNGSINRGRILGGAYGAYLSLTGGALAIDSTVVSGTKTVGIYAAPSAGVAITGRKNNVTDNLGIGLQNVGAGTVAFNLGRFVGNQQFGVSGTVDATNSWWGDPFGPGNFETSGDFYTGSVLVTPYLTTDPADVPPLGPPANIFAASTWQKPLFGGAGASTPMGAVTADDEIGRPDPAARRQEIRRLAQERRAEHLQLREQRQARRERSSPQ